MEKKPLYHFLPGAPILSIGTPGCNLRCAHCQNWSISQPGTDRPPAISLPPEAVAPLARRRHCPAVAYTYAEPLVSYDYTLDGCRAAREAGLHNVLVTAAYVNTEPLTRLCRYVDAANIDIKAMSETFYHDVCGASLQPVLEATECMCAAGVWVEITNLIIPTLNDAESDLRDLCVWMRTRLGAEVPLHFSRFFPQHRMRHLPPTPLETLQTARRIAVSEGLRHVYLGNVTDADGSDTRCTRCETTLIRRSAGAPVQSRLRNGCCPDCGHALAGRFTRDPLHASETP